MALTKGWVTTAGTAAYDARFIEQAHITKNINDVPRVGLLYGDINPVLATSSMSVTVKEQAVYVVSRKSSDGVSVITNVGSQTLAIDPAPSANSRYSVVYVRHTDTESGDSSSAPMFGVVSGTASASPVVPAVPAGALAIATVLVPAGVAATNASGVTISNIVPCTSIYGAPIRYRSVTEMNADSANVIEGTQGYIKGGDLYWMRGGSWVAVSNADTGWISLPVPATMNSNAAYRRFNGVVYLRGNISLKSGQFANGYTDVTTLPAGFRPSAYIRGAISMFNGYTASLVVGTDGTMQIGASSDRTADTVYLGAISFPVS